MHRNHHPYWQPVALDKPARAAIKHQIPRCIWFKTPLDVCVQRDPKGLYARARQGEITNISGYDAPYEDARRRPA